MSQLTEEQLRRKKTNIAILTCTLVALGVMALATITVLALGDVAEPATPQSAPKPSSRTEYVPSKNMWVPVTPLPVSTSIPPTPGPSRVRAVAPTPRPSYRQEARALWAELQKMRTDPEFLQCGYGAGCGPGAAWQRRVKNLNEQGGRRLFAQYGFVVTDLLSIGMDYMEGRPGDMRLETRVKEGLGLR